MIAQTAAFVREAGGQSEFRLGVAQAGNPNFAFLRPDDRLFPYYRWLLQADPQVHALLTQNKSEMHVNIIGWCTAHVGSLMVCAND